MQKGKTNTKLPRTICTYIYGTTIRKSEHDYKAQPEKHKLQKLPREKVVLLALLRQKQQQQLRKRVPIGEPRSGIVPFRREFYRCRNLVANLREKLIN